MGLFGNKERKNWRRYENAFMRYEKGEITKAIKTIMNPAADGFAPAQQLMGVLRIERKMYDDAEYWLTSAIKNGYTQAQADLDYLRNEVLKKEEPATAVETEEKQPAPQQAAPEPKPAQPQKTEQQLRAEIEAELRAKMEAELKAKIEAELQLKLEKEKQLKAAMQEKAENTVVEARNLCASGDIDTAEKMLAELLAEMPDFRSAQLLMEEIQDVKAWEKEKAEKERAEKAAKEKAEAEARAKAEEEEKERLKAELRAKVEAKVKAEMEAEAKAKAEVEEKARLEKLAKETAKQPEPAENSGEIFTPQRLACMEAVAAKGRERQRQIKEEYIDHWPDQLDEAERLYRSGEYKKAFNEAIIYEEASARAVNMLGAMYLTGRGTEKDLVKARDCFSLARRIGYMPARYNMAMMILQVDGDEEEAFNAMEHLADEGYLPAMLQAGKMYMDGIGVYEDPEGGWFWLCQAACNGHMETARRIVEDFFEQPDKIFYLRSYLDRLCAAGDTELTKKLALLFMHGIPNKMGANLNHLRRYRDILKEQGYSIDDLM